MRSNVEGENQPLDISKFGDAEGLRQKMSVKSLLFFGAPETSKAWLVDIAAQVRAELETETESRKLLIRSSGDPDAPEDLDDELYNFDTVVGCAPDGDTVTELAYLLGCHHPRGVLYAEGLGLPRLMRLGLRVVSNLDELMDLIKFNYF